MCNPREITVTATRLIDEAWQHAISRTVTLTGRVTGEARIRERLDASLAAPVVRAFEMGIANDAAWVQIQDAYRHDVEGGYVIYHLHDRSLEIVATAYGDTSAEGTEEQALAGRLTEELQAAGEGRYYDDGWGGRNEMRARTEAEGEAQRKLEEARLARLDQAKREAADQVATQLDEAARVKAEAELQRRSAALRAELDASARRHLDMVGVRARQVFYRSLGNAYRDAILSYARRNKAEGIQCHEDGDTIEIEFQVER